MLPQGVELVEYREGLDGYIFIQMAIHGKLAPAIDTHKSSRADYANDAAYFAHLARRSEEFIHLYGDAKNPLPEEEVLRRSQEPF